MNRREFIRRSAACGALGAASAVAQAPSANAEVMTVLGPVSPGQIGSALSHEHVLVDFIGAETITRDRYDATDVFDVALPHLRRARDLGCRAFVECTPAYFGRDPRLLARLASAAGLHILTNTGYCGAALEQFDMLAQEKVRPDAFIWVHAQSDWELGPRVEAARTGAWIEIDNIGDKTIPACVERVAALKARGCRPRLLVSHDAGWYRPGEPRGGDFRGFETVYTAFVAALRESGWTDEEVHRLLVTNPAEAFAIRVRTVI